MGEGQESHGLGGSTTPCQNDVDDDYDDDVDDDDDGHQYACLLQVKVKDWSEILSKAYR